MLTRRQFIKFGGVAGVGALLTPRLDHASLFAAFAPLAVAQGTPLPGSAIPQFVDPLPLLSVAGGRFIL